MKHESFRKINVNCTRSENLMYVVRKVLGFVAPDANNHHVQSHFVSSQLFLIGLEQKTSFPGQKSHICWPEFQLVFSQTIPNPQQIPFKHLFFDEDCLQNQQKPWKQPLQAARRRRKQDLCHDLTLYSHRTQ